ncbi:FG-GAP-like repeat-containing protein [Streptomyces sp. NPDC046261]|uniref:FG-GAP-like repeat-containing protein n=1 Tax=Streptomyces sp. NPDC046261 TaxID=3157200 RepID=UPI0033E69D32
MIKRSRAGWTAAVLASAIGTAALTAAPAQAVVGGAAKDGQYAFTAKFDIGGKRGCTGALVDAQWALTAASCFADDPGQGFRITGGKPKEKTTVTVGRTDLTSTAGATVEAVELVPRGDRDLVMVKLATPVTGVTPVTVGTAEPRQGEDVQVAGYGRTKDEWAPDRLHTAAFGIGAVTGATLELAGKSADASLCKGDTGGPVLREKNGKAELAALSTASWQGGCWGADESETRKGATATRVDDVNGWIQQQRLTGVLARFTDVVTSADFNGDGRTDIAAVLKDGSLHAFYAGPDGTLQYGRELWHDKTWDGKKKIIGGDFNGDGKADILAVAGDGSLHLYAGTDTGKLATAVKAWKDTSWAKIDVIARYKAPGASRDGLIAQWDDKSLFAYTTNPDGTLSGQKKEVWRDKTWTKKYLATGDFNGDGRDDIAAVAATGALHLYAGNAKGSFDDARGMWRDDSWGSMRFVLGGDFTGDGKADIVSRWSGKGIPHLYVGDGKGALADGRSVWPVSS